MKTLHLLIILAVLFGTPVLVFHLTENSQAFGSVQNLQLFSSKFNYVDGEIISISGDTLQNFVVHIFLVDNHGNIENSTQVRGNATGDFNASLGIPLHATGGAWSLFANDGESNFATQIMVNDDENPPPFNTPSGFAPLKQFKLGIESKDIACKEGTVLVIKSDSGFPACVKPGKSSRLVVQGWVPGPINKVIADVHNVYYTNDTINFSINFNGFVQGCDYPHMTILDSNQSVVWKSNSLVISCDPEMNMHPVYVNQTYQLSDGLGGPITIPHEGDYTLKVSFYDQNLNTTLYCNCAVQIWLELENENSTSCNNYSCWNCIYCITWDSFSVYCATSKTINITICL